MVDHCVRHGVTLALMSAPSGTLNCPGCGGRAEPESVRCEWCGAPLATVACPKCFGIMFVGMKHCPACGSEASREEKPERAPGPCPRCSVEMFLVEVGKTVLSECRRCGGLWVDNTSFQRICEDRENQERVLGIAVTIQENPIASAPGSRMYVPCPVCTKLMNRLNFGGSSGVIIDWCKDHGSWFDSNELRQIVTFIQGGGLKKTRQRQKEKLEEEARRLRAQEMKLGRSLPIPTNASINWQGDDASLVEFLSAVWKTLSK